MRKSTIFFSFIAFCCLLLAALIFHQNRGRAEERAIIAANARLAKSLMLTDLCLFTEARYTRNPSLTDTHSAFQDHPLAIEHFPSGSLVAPPRILSESP
ncbi:MAG TPA: hypothetical protein VMC44_04890 [Geobacteraceae bacterium]|nr:hypothetical protein [Geobacteraceae bacterium]